MSLIKISFSKMRNFSKEFDNMQWFIGVFHKQNFKIKLCVSKTKPGFITEISMFLRFLNVVNWVKCLLSKYVVSATKIAQSS